MIQNVWLIPALPLLAFLVNGLFGRRWLKLWTGWIAAGAVAASALLAIGVFMEVLGGHERTTVTLYRWIGVGDFNINVSALVDPLSSVMLLVVTVVGTLIFIFANGYKAHDHGFARFFTWFSLFVFAMLILVMADNYLLMFVGWEGVGLCSYLLIGFWFEKPAPQHAANKAFCMTRIVDWGYVMGVMLLFFITSAAGKPSISFFDQPGTGRTAAFNVISSAAVEPFGWHAIFAGGLTSVALLLFIGAAGKSAQIPLYVWLPDA